MAVDEKGQMAEAKRTTEDVEQLLQSDADLMRRAVARLMRRSADLLEAEDENVISVAFLLHLAKEEGGCRMLTAVADTCEGPLHMAEDMVRVAAGLFISARIEEPYGAASKDLLEWITEEINAGRFVIYDT